MREGRQLVGVPTSEASRQRAAALGIEQLSEEGPWPIDMCVDGADEVSEELDLIKGGGGCHTREKIVNRASACNIIVVDNTCSPNVGGIRLGESSDNNTVSGNTCSNGGVGVSVNSSQYNTVSGNTVSDTFLPPFPTWRNGVIGASRFGSRGRKVSDTV